MRAIFKYKFTQLYIFFALPWRQLRCRLLFQGWRPEYHYFPSDKKCSLQHFPTAPCESVWPTKEGERKVGFKYSHEQEIKQTNNSLLRHGLVQWNGDESRGEDGNNACWLKSISRVQRAVTARQKRNHNLSIWLSWKASCIPPITPNVGGGEGGGTALIYFIFHCFLSFMWLSPSVVTYYLWWMHFFYNDQDHGLSLISFM